MSLVVVCVTLDYQVKRFHDGLIQLQIEMMLFDIDVQNATMQSFTALVYLVQSHMPYPH